MAIYPKPTSGQSRSESILGITSEWSVWLRFIEVSTISRSTRATWPAGCRCPQASHRLFAREGVIPCEKKLACTPAEHCAQAFGQYLLEVRALGRRGKLRGTRDTVRSDTVIPYFFNSP
jgi:hypothetical protein